jgi:hypothetical protein
MPQTHRPTTQCPPPAHDWPVQALNSHKSRGSFDALNRRGAAAPGGSVNALNHKRIALVLMPPSASANFFCSHTLHGCAATGSGRVSWSICQRSMRPKLHVFRSGRSASSTFCGTSASLPPGIGGNGSASATGVCGVRTMAERSASRRFWRSKSVASAAPVW